MADHRDFWLAVGPWSGRCRCYPTKHENTFRPHDGAWHGAQFVVLGQSAFEQEREAIKVANQNYRSMSPAQYEAELANERARVELKAARDRARMERELVS